MPIPENALGHLLSAELTSLAICWQLVRQDGVALGFTTHDRPLVIGGMTYESAPGMAPSAVTSSDGLAIDTMDVAGALSADAITAADLAEGRYDGAQVRLFMVDWHEPDAGAQRLARGTLGTVEAGTGPGARYTATLRGPTSVLATTRIETYSPECRAELGDWRCRVAMRGRVTRSTLADVEGAWVRIEGIDGMLAGNFLGGRLRVLSGTLAGVDRSLIAVAGDRLRIDEPLAVAAGESVELREGCDKQFSTCAGRFDNAINFRGEPHVPGSDVLTRFGGL